MRQLKRVNEMRKKKKLARGTVYGCTAVQISKVLRQYEKGDKTVPAVRKDLRGIKQLALQFGLTLEEFELGLKFTYTPRECWP